MIPDIKESRHRIELYINIKSEKHHLEKTFFDRYVLRIGNTRLPRILPLSPMPTYDSTSICLIAQHYLMLSLYFFILIIEYI
jgi:hypothetical protein